MKATTNIFIISIDQMSTTLKERVTERMQVMGLKNAALAKICGVQPPTSFNWASGKTQNIKGAPLLKAAAAFGVNPEWLASGKGPKFPTAQNTKNEQPLPEKPDTGNDQWTREAVEIMSKLEEPDKRAVIANMKTFIQNLNPIQSNPASSSELHSSAGGESPPLPRQKAA